MALTPAFAGPSVAAWMTENGQALDWPSTTAAPMPRQQAGQKLSPTPSRSRPAPDWWRVVDVPMRPAGCIPFKDDMRTPTLQRALDFGLLVKISMWNGNIAGAVIQMVTNRSPALAGLVYYLFERIGNLRLSSARMLNDPRVHLANMLGLTIYPQELRPVRKPPLRHQFSLSADCPHTASSTYGHVGKLALKFSNKPREGRRRRDTFPCFETRRLSTVSNMAA